MNLSQAEKWYQIGSDSGHDESKKEKLKYIAFLKREDVTSKRDQSKDIYRAQEFFLKPNAFLTMNSTIQAQWMVL